MMVPRYARLVLKRYLGDSASSAVAQVNVFCELAGTNTEFSKVRTGNWQAGEIATIEFTQRINLNAGQYLLSLGCVDLSAGELKIYDRRHDFLAFQVITDRAIVGLVDLHSEVSIRR